MFHSICFLQYTSYGICHCIYLTLIIFVSGYLDYVPHTNSTSLQGPQANVDRIKKNEKKKSKLGDQILVFSL